MDACAFPTSRIRAFSTRARRRHADRRQRPRHSGIGRTDLTLPLPNALAWRAKRLIIITLWRMLLQLFRIAVGTRIAPWRHAENYAHHRRLQSRPRAIAASGHQ
jgi:hypothetical protein